MKVYVVTRSGGGEAREYEESFCTLGVYKEQEDASEFFHSLVDDAIEDGGFSKTPLEEDEADDRAVFQHPMEHPMDNMDEIFLRYWEDSNGDLHMIDEYQNQYMICTAEELK